MAQFQPTCPICGARVESAADLISVPPERIEELLSGNTDIRIFDSDYAPLIWIFGPMLAFAVIATFIMWVTGAFANG